MPRLTRSEISRSSRVNSFVITLRILGSYELLGLVVGVSAECSGLVDVSICGLGMAEESGSAGWIDASEAGVKECFVGAALELMDGGSMSRMSTPGDHPSNFELAHL